MTGIMLVLYYPFVLTYGFRAVLLSTLTDDMNMKQLKNE